MANENVFAEYIISTPAQFWQELDETLSVPSKATLEQIDLALRTVIYFCARYYHEFLSGERELDLAVRMLLSSRFYTSHSDRMVSLLMDLVETRQSQDPTDSVPRLYVLLHALRLHGHEKPHVFKLLRQPRQSAYTSTSRPFIQLLTEILSRTEEEAHASGSASSVEGRIGFEATDLVYEILRVKRLTPEEIPLFSEAFITHLFEIVESTRDGDEAYNYAVVRLIIALNEQFMVASLELYLPTSSSHSQSPGALSHPKPPSEAGRNTPKKQQSLSTEASNLVLKILRQKLGESKTFGENLIFILNRLNSNSNGSTPEDLCVSLLILKILYLLFSTASTSEYFYTNDLRVLVDVFIRELLDLPEESEGLRHTYLRVLHPLMTNTQLRTYPYKHQAVRACLLSLLSDEHLRTVSPTTRRLVERNLRADWCSALSPPPASKSEIDAEAKIAQRLSTIALKGPATHMRREGEEVSPISPAGVMENGLLGSAMPPGLTQSTLSVNEVADAAHPRQFGFFRKNRRLSEKKEKPKKVPPPVDRSLRKHRSHANLCPSDHIVHHGNASTPQLPLSIMQGSSRLTASASADALHAHNGVAENTKKNRIPPPRPPKNRTSDVDRASSDSRPVTPPPQPDNASHLSLPVGTDTLAPPSPRSVGTDGSSERLDHHAEAPLAPASAGLRAKFRRAPPPTPSRKRAGTNASALSGLSTTSTEPPPIPDHPLPA